MFEFLAQRSPTDVSAATDLAIRVIADRATIVVPSAPDEWGDAPEIALAVRALRTIEEVEGSLLAALSESRARHYVQQLAAIVDASITAEVGADADRGYTEKTTPQLLKELRAVAINSIGTWSPFEPMSSFGIMVLAVGLIVIEILVLYVGSALWPLEMSDESLVPRDGARLFGVSFTLSADARLMLLVMLAGALGSALSATHSFVTFVGNRLMRASWFWWYATQPFNGAVLSLIFYLVLRGGGLSIEPAGPRLFAVVTMAALVGLFSSQALTKMSEIFSVLFKVPPARVSSDSGTLRGSK